MLFVRFVSTFLLYQAQFPGDGPTLSLLGTWKLGKGIEGASRRNPRLYTMSPYQIYLQSSRGERKKVHPQICLCTLEPIG